MASKRRLRRKSCGNKRRYDTRKEALRAALGFKYRTKDKGYLAAYKCQFCGGYHWGHRG